MAETQKKTRKTARPRLDAIVRHIKAGSYDGDWAALTEAIEDRRKIRQERIQEMAREVFGKHARVVVDEHDAPDPPQERGLNPFLKDMNPFIKKAEQDPDLKAAEEAALARERELAAEAGDVLPADSEDDPDIESRSPIIGSVE